MGFSAGGHLAVMTAISFEKPAYEPIDDVDRASCRPDFAVVAYPGYILTRPGSDVLADGVRIPKGTGPIFIVHASDDDEPGAKLEQSLALYRALRNAGVPVELHIYDEGGHGFGVRKSRLPVSRWPDRCAEWFRHRGFLPAGTRGRHDATSTYRRSRAAAPRGEIRETKASATTRRRSSADSEKGGRPDRPARTPRRPKSGRPGCRCFDITKNAPWGRSSRSRARIPGRLGRTRPGGGRRVQMMTRDEILRTRQEHIDEMHRRQSDRTALIVTTCSAASWSRGRRWRSLRAERSLPTSSVSVTPAGGDRCPSSSRSLCTPPAVPACAGNRSVPSTCRPDRASSRAWGCRRVTV